MTILLTLLLAGAGCGNATPPAADSPAIQAPIIIEDTASQKLQPSLLSGAVFIKEVTGHSTAQIPDFREYYPLALADAKRKAARAGANVLVVTYYHNFSIIPFGARVRVSLYRADSRAYQAIQAKLADAADQRRREASSACILHVKGYQNMRVSLYLDDSLIFEDNSKGPGGINSMVPHRPEHTFLFKHGGRLYGSLSGLAHKDGGYVLAAGREYFFIVTTSPHITSRRMHGPSLRPAVHFRDVEEDVFRRDY